MNCIIWWVSCSFYHPGCGIPQDDLARIFEPFVQLGQREGTGLGLTITRQFVRLLGGEISIRSEPGRGSTFSFSIAYEPVTSARIPAVPTPALPILRIENAPAFRLLVIEDQPENRQLLLGILQPWGFSLRAAGDGRAGLALVREWQPHLVFMDRRMPEMDGLTATREIRRLPLDPRPVIVAITAHAFPEERREMLEAGCDAFLAKPLEINALLTMLETVLPLRVVREEAAATASEPVLDTAALAALPEALQAELADALTRLDVQRIEALIQTVCDLVPPLGNAMTFYAKRFAYGTLLAALPHR